MNGAAAPRTAPSLLAPIFPEILREERVARALYPKGAGKMVESAGGGYLPPHQARVASMSAGVRRAANVDWGMPLMQG